VSREREHPRGEKLIYEGSSESIKSIARQISEIIQVDSPSAAETRQLFYNPLFVNAFSTNNGPMPAANRGESSLFECNVG